LSLLLEGKRAFVSGGTRGIGAAICEVFAREGADVAFNYQSRDDLADVVRGKVEAHGRRALSFKMSVTDRFGMKQIAREIKDAWGGINVLLDVQAIFLAGKNDELRRDAEEIARDARFPVKVIGYSDEVEKLMHSANVMISKLGGLTTFEALACRLPIIADATTPPMPQEAGTVQMLERRGAGILLRNSIDIVPMIQNLLSDSVGYARMRAATSGMTMPDSTDQIIREINALLPQPFTRSQAAA
jgi:NAD(P)-dependent dehydrogenase (short-subunit alcohol dehydrogenase family)